MLLGLWINPYKVLVAYSRGRKTRNLYHDLMPDETALSSSIRDLKALLKLDNIPSNVKPTAGDVLAFGLFLIPSVLYAVVSMVFMPVIIVYTVYVMIRKRNERFENKY